MSSLRLSSKNIIREYELTKRRSNSYNIACLSSRAAKGSLDSTKSNYCAKELEWYEKFISKN